MDKNSKTRKQLAFDLDTKVCEAILGSNYHIIYREIRDFMISNGFIHIQGSVYVSQNELSVVEVLNLLYDLRERIPYIEKCIRDIRQADVSREHSLNDFFDYDGTPGIYQDYYKDISGQVMEEKKTQIQPPEESGPKLM